MKPDVYSLYCPLRNFLRKQKLDDSLLAIHAHIQFQQFHKPLPGYIVGEPPGYRNTRKFSDLLNFHVFPWELSLLCKEILLNSPKYGQKRSLLHWHYLSGAINKLKELENEIAKLYSTSENVLLEISLRIPHREFRWQRFPTLDAPARYWKIFSHKNLRSLIEESIGLTIEDIIKIGMGLLGVFDDKIALFYPPQINIPEIDRKKLDKFLDHFCLSYADLKKKLIDEQQYNEKFVYAYSSLVAFPLIRTEWEGRDAILCPTPRYLFERITDGLYYEICKKRGFDHAFGEAFQTYVGDVLRVLYKGGGVYQESEYGKNKRTVDWIMEDGTAILFIECKTKRLTIGAKAELFNLEELGSELGKLADAIVQTYKTMDDYKKGLYPQIEFDKEKKVYPVIITLEDWFLYGNPIVDKLDKQIVKKLKEEGLDENLVKSNPYCVMSVETFESFVFIANTNNIHEILEEKIGDPEKRYWEIENYLHSKYPSLVRRNCPFTSELSQRIESMID